MLHICYLLYLDLYFEYKEFLLFLNPFYVHYKEIQGRMKAGMPGFKKNVSQLNKAIAKMDKRIKKALENPLGAMGG